MYYLPHKSFFHTQYGGKRTKENVKYLQLKCGREEKVRNNKGHNVKYTNHFIESAEITIQMSLVKSVQIIWLVYVFVFFFSFVFISFDLCLQI